MGVNLKRAYYRRQRAGSVPIISIAIIIIAALVIAPAEGFAARREAGRSGRTRDAKKKNDAERMAERLKKPGKADSVNQPSPPRRKNKPVAPAPKAQNATAPKAQAVAPTKLPARLAVITAIADANVTVKKSGNVVQSGRSQAGRYEAELPPGEYEVEIELPEKTIYFSKVIVAQGHTQTLSVEQPKAEPVRFGTIIIELGRIDQDVSVLVDGEKPASVTDISETRIRLENIPYGTHRLRFSHPSIKDLERMVEVATPTTSINPPFEVIAGKLIILSEPGASIYIDGRREGKVSESGEIALYITPGQHAIRAEKDGYSASEYPGYFGLDRMVINLKLASKKK